MHVPLICVHSLSENASDEWFWQFSHTFILHASERSQQVWQHWDEAVILLIFLSGWISVLLRVGWVNQPCYHCCLSRLRAAAQRKRIPAQTPLIHPLKCLNHLSTGQLEHDSSLSASLPLNPLRTLSLLFLFLFLSSLHQTTQSGGQMCHIS